MRKLHDIIAIDADPKSHTRSHYAMAYLLSARRLDSSLAAAALAAVVVLPGIASAQGGGQQQPYENLKFFSKDTPRDSLLAIMRGFTYALGVECAYCHVEEPQPNGRARMRPGLEDKVEKQKARFMLGMTDTLNRVTLAALPSRHEGVRIDCVTCHRGWPIPGTIAYVDGRALGPLTTLRTIPAENAEKICYYSLNKAQSRFGLGVQAPVVEVFTRSSPMAEDAC